MGLLKTEHGRVGYLADLVLYAAASASLAMILAVWAPAEQRAVLAIFALAGIAAWTLVEYVLHRFVLHGLQPFRRWHAEHHRRPGATPGRYGVTSALWDVVFRTNDGAVPQAQD
jgi:sterol desaturase/sphingolipid hydroxylase (fatty acid hydroxylase superfamily)